MGWRVGGPKISHKIEFNTFPKTIENLEFVSKSFSFLAIFNENYAIFKSVRKVKRILAEIWRKIIKNEEFFIYNGLGLEAHDAGEFINKKSKHQWKLTISLKILINYGRF